MQTLNIVLLFIGTASSLEADGPSKGPVLSEQLVARDQGYFPVAQRLKDGRIAVVLRGGAPHLGVKGRLDIVFSADDGQTWSPPTVVNDSPVDDRNPAFGQAADGTLVVGFWRTARYDDNGKYAPNRTDKAVSTWATRSRDGGKTWDEATEIDVRDIGYGSPYGKMILLPDRSLLMSVYGEQPRAPGEAVNAREEWSYLYRSTDDGKTWSRYATIAAKRFNETSVVLLKSGRMIAAMRAVPPEQAVWTCHSENLGKTWSEPDYLSPAKHHPADLIELSDGRVLMTLGCRAGKFGVVGVVSNAQGRFNWAEYYSLVDDATSTDCGYPSSVLLPDGLALTVYYAVGRKGKPDWRTHCGAIIHRLPAPR